MCWSSSRVEHIQTLNRSRPTFTRHGYFTWSTVVTTIAWLHLTRVAAQSQRSAIIRQSSRSYVHGDHVTAIKRSLYQGFRSGWSELGGRLAPRFEVESTVELIPGSATQLYSADSPFKLAFSFSDDQFHTSWITVSDGMGTYLEVIEFEFECQDGRIVQVKTATHYHDTNIHPGEPPAHIYLRYRWTHSKQIDSSRGFAVLFIASVSIAVISTISVVRSSFAT